MFPVRYGLNSYIYIGRRDVTLPSTSDSFCMAYSATLKMEAALSSETSVNLYQTIWRYILEDSILLWLKYLYCGIFA
jgi:hypothetical protein